MDAAQSEGEKRLPCAKYNCYQDRQDPHCSDPELYCKFRTSCLINFMQKNIQRQDDACVRPR
jgi:hypothetical protein